MEEELDGGAVARVLGKQIERLQVEMRHARAEIAALRNRVDANEVRIEEVVLLINEFREYVEARLLTWTPA